jgi:hypothetical protein
VETLALAVETFCVETLALALAVEAEALADFLEPYGALPFQQESVVAHPSWAPMFLKLQILYIIYDYVTSIAYVHIV